MSGAMNKIANHESRITNHEIVPAMAADWPGIWALFHDVVSAGDTYAYAPETSEAEAREIWMGRAAHGTPAHTYVAKEKNVIVGTYSLRANHYGLGGHVANAGYMVHKDYRGRGIATAMCYDSMEKAKSLGFKAMQFNYVVSTNTRAVELWRHMGFSIIGIAPKSFRHRKHGFVDVYIMHRFLDGMSV